MREGPRYTGRFGACSLAAIAGAQPALAAAAAPLYLGQALFPADLIAPASSGDRLRAELPRPTFAGSALADQDAAAQPGPAPAPASSDPATLPASPPAAAPAPVPEVRLNRTNRTMAVVVSVKDGDSYVGDLDVQITPDDTLLVSVDQLLSLLSPRLSAARLAQLRSAIPAAGFAPQTAFATAGLPLQFDKRSFELRFDLAVADRASQTIGLADLDRANIGDFARPEPFSAYVNVRGSVDYIHKGSASGLTDPFFLFDGAARLSGFVLEAEGAWSGIDKRFTRSGTRVVYDDSKNLIRWTGGDLLAQNRGFQGSLDIGGIGFERTYALLDPQRNVAPRGGRTFSLERNATVEAVINGRPVRSLRLSPGTYNLSDFPFAQGGNDVELIIVDDTGRREVIAFSLFVERSQLAKGLSEFSVNLGVLTRRQDNIHYTKKPTLTGFYRRGITDSLTLGANAQYSDKAYLVGGEAVFGTGWGTIGGDVAVSNIPGVGAGWAINFSIERITQATDGGSSLIATVEARSRRFGAVGQVGADNPYVFNAQVSYNRTLSRSSFAGIQARYAKARTGFVDEKSVRLSYGRRLDRMTNLIFDAEWDKGLRGNDKSFRVSLVRRFGNRSSARAEFDSRDDSARFGFQSSGGYGVGSWAGSGNIDVSSDTYTLNASGNYIANRADLAVAHTTAYSPDLKTVTDQRSSFRAATSLAFAGGAFAIGRPISDSFAIVRPYKKGQGIGIEVEQSQGSHQASSGIFGPALYGQISSYSARTITYDVPNASAGLDIGAGSLRAFAPYRSGYLVTVGSDYNVMAIGRLVQNGQPLALRVGKAREIGAGGREVEFFTNRQGQFGASGLKPGRWRIEMLDTPPIVYEIEVPESAVESGIFRAGDIRPIGER